MLILNSFHDHTISFVINKLVEKNTNIAIIPGGCTSKLQLLDNAVNKSFKSKVNLLLYYFLIYILYILYINIYINL